MQAAGTATPWVLFLGVQDIDTEVAEAPFSLNQPCALS